MNCKPASAEVVGGMAKPQGSEPKRAEGVVLRVQDCNPGDDAVGQRGDLRLQLRLEGRLVDRFPRPCRTRPHGPRNWACCSTHFVPRARPSLNRRGTAFRRRTRLDRGARTASDFASCDVVCASHVQFLFLGRIVV